MACPTDRVPRWTFPRRDDGGWEARDRAALLDHVLDGLAEGVVVTDADGRIVFWNRTAPRLLGAEPAGTALCSWFDAAGLEPPGGGASCSADNSPLGRALRGAEVPEEDWRLAAHGDREPRVLAVVAHPLRGVGDAVEGSIVVVRDVTARTRASESLERLSRAVDQTADAVVITDREGVILYVNPAFTAMTGYTQADALGRTPSLLKSGAHPPEDFARLWATILRGDVYHGTIVNRRKDGKTYSAEQTITPMRDRPAASRTSSRSPRT